MFSLSALAILLIGTASGLPTTAVPSFEWIQGDPIYKAALKITYPNGQSDIALLNPYSPIPAFDRSDLCIFNGYLQDESDSYVTLSGCPQDGDFEIMFRSQHLEDFMFRSTSGKVEVVQPLMGSTAVNRDGLQVTYSDRVVDMQGPEIISKDLDETRQILNPKGYIIRTKIRYDDGFKRNFVGKVEKTISTVMAFAQAQFRLPSLATSFELDLSSPPEYIRGVYNANYDLDAVAAMSKDPNFDAYVYLVCSKNSDGTLGIAYKGTTCGKDVTGRTSLNEWEGDDLNTGLTVAHEMGHNLGMGHDFGPGGEDDVRRDSMGKSCTKVGGIMDYTAPFKLWTTCSNEDFKKYFAKAQPWCLKAK